MSSGLIVTTRHLFTVPGHNKRCGFCRSGTREWAKRQGLDWSDFVRNGIPAERLEATGDALALAVVAWARKCEEANG